MNKRPTGPAIPPTLPTESEMHKLDQLHRAPIGPTDVGIRPILTGRALLRRVFIQEWTKSNYNFVRLLKTFSKDGLIAYVIDLVAGPQYDKFNPPYDPAVVDETIKAMEHLREELRKPCNLDEQRLALTKYENAMLKMAGEDIERVALIAKALGETRARFEELPKIKAFKDRSLILANGRVKGVKARQETAKGKQARLIEAIADLFDKPEKPGWGWSNPEIVRFLSRRFGYADSTVVQVVRREAAKFRKARKEQQASKFRGR